MNGQIAGCFAARREFLNLVMRSNCCALTAAERTCRARASLAMSFFLRTSCFLSNCIARITKSGHDTDLDTSIWHFSSGSADFHSDNHCSTVLAAGSLLRNPTVCGDLATKLLKSILTRMSCSPRGRETDITDLNCLV